MERSLGCRGGGAGRVRTPDLPPVVGADVDRARDRERQVARIANDLVVYRDVTFPVRFESRTGMGWEIVHPYEWLTCFSRPPSLHREYSR